MGPHGRVGYRKGIDCRNKVGSWYQPVDFQGYPGDQPKSAGVKSALETKTGDKGEVLRA